MTPDLLDLARTVVASPHWRWCIGMSDHRGWLVIAVLPNGQIDAVYDPCSGESREPYPDPLPDLTDPATQGWIAALVREAWGDPNIQAPANPADLVRLLLSAPSDAWEKLSAQLLSQREESND